MRSQGEERLHRYIEKGAHLFSAWFNIREEMTGGLIEKKMGGSSLQRSSLSRQNNFQVVDCHPKTLGLQQTVRNGTSQRNALSLYRKRHITASGLKNSSLHEVTKFWGQHSHSLGVKLTPQLDQENARAHAHFLRTCKHVHTTARTHSCVSSMTHIFLLLRKLADPSMC